MSDILYVSRSPVYDHILNSQITKNHNVTVLGPWNPSNFMRKILKSALFPNSVSSLFLTRPKQKLHHRQIGSITKINLGLWEFAVPVLGKLHLPKYSAHIQRYSEVKILKKVQKYVAFYNSIIITDDFLSAELDLVDKKVVLEIRGGTFLRSDQIRTIQRRPIDLYLNTKFSSLSEPQPNERLVKIDSNLQLISEFITYSKFYKELVQEAYPQKNVWIMPLTFPSYDIPESIEIVRKSQSLLFVGRDEPIKGLDLAVNIAVTLDLPIKIVGTYSRSMTKSLSSVKNVIVEGPLNRSQLFELMKNSSVLISPTIETFGYSILESLALGTPVLTSRYAGVTEWVENCQLLHVMNDFNLESWCDRVKQILVSQQSRSRDHGLLPEDKK